MNVFLFSMKLRKQLMKVDYRCTEFNNDVFPSEIEINQRKQILLTVQGYSNTDNHYSKVSDRRMIANRMFRECYNNKCVYCGVPITINGRRLFEVDHYIPKSSKKLNIDFNNISNLVNACYECNRKKSYFEIDNNYLDLLNPNNSIFKLFIRNKDFGIEINKKYSNNSEINKFYNKLCFGGELRRLDYLLMSMKDLQETIHSDVIVDKLARCIQILQEKRNLFIES